MQGYHSFSKEAALRYGLAEAIILYGLACIVKNSKYDFDVLLVNGKRYIKLTCSQLQGLMPYLSPFKIKTGLEVLKASRLIDITDFEGPPAVRSRRWHYYTVTDKGLEFLSEEKINDY